MEVVSTRKAAFVTGKCAAAPITSNIPLWQTLHAFLLNIRNFPPEVNNIQQREVELNVILSRINNVLIKQKRHGIFVLLYIPSTKQNQSGSMLTRHFKLFLYKRKINSKILNCFILFLLFPFFLESPNHYESLVQ